MAYLNVGQVRFDPANHLSFLEHLLGLRLGRRLLAPLDRRRREVVALVDGAAGHPGTGHHLVHGHHGGRRRLAAQLQHRKQVVRRRAHVRQRAHLLGDHPQLLKVDEPVDARVVAHVDERQILLDDREERYL